MGLRLLETTIRSGYFREKDDFTHGRNKRLAVKSFYAAIDHWYIVINEISRPD